MDAVQRHFQNKELLLCTYKYIAVREYTTFTCILSYVHLDISFSQISERRGDIWTVIDPMDLSPKRVKR